MPGVLEHLRKPEVLEHPGMPVLERLRMLQMTTKLQHQPSPRKGGSRNAAYEPAGFGQFAGRGIRQFSLFFYCFSLPKIIIMDHR
jgi:hypothetical protein